MASTQYDTLLGCVLFILSLVRLSELCGLSDGPTYARVIVFLMWLLPLALFVWLAWTRHRIDAWVFSGITLLFVVGTLVALIAGYGGYDLIPPDLSMGTSNGLLQWIRTDGAISFLPLSFYILLTIGLIYLTVFSFFDSYYWALAVATLTGFIIGITVSNYWCGNHSTSWASTMGSLSTLVMMGVGVIAIYLAPG